MTFSKTWSYLTMLVKLCRKTNCFASTCSLTGLPAFFNALTLLLGRICAVNMHLSYLKLSNCFLSKLLGSNFWSECQSFYDSKITCQITLAFRRKISRRILLYFRIRCQQNCCSVITSLSTLFVH